MALDFKNQQKIGRYLFWYDVDPCGDVLIENTHNGEAMLLTRKALVDFVKFLSQQHKCNTCGNDFNIKDMITVRTGLPSPGDVMRDIKYNIKQTSKVYYICKKCHNKSLPSFKASDAIKQERDRMRKMGD